MLIALLVPLGLAILLFSAILVRSALAKRALPRPEMMAVGAVVNFFDTLGIGSFATTTAWLKFRKLVLDRLLPQTMLVGLTPPSMLQAVIFLILLGVLVILTAWALIVVYVRWTNTHYDHRVADERRSGQEAR